MDLQAVVIGIFLAAFAIPVTFESIMWVVGSGSLANVASFTPGAVGVTQATNALALKTCCNVPQSQAIDYSTAQQLITTAWNQIFALVLVIVVFGWVGGKQLVTTPTRTPRSRPLTRRPSASASGPRRKRRRSERSSPTRAVSELDLSRAGPGLARRDAVTDDAYVFSARSRPRRPTAAHRLSVLSRSFVATLAIGIIAAFVIGDFAASPSSTPKTWVAIIDVVFGAFLIGYVVRAMRQPVKPEKVEGMVNQMSRIASSPAIAVVARAPRSRTRGGFIPLALKTISETDPSAAQYIGEWVFFTLMSLLPLAVRS